jgi:hypothetical protein
MTDLQQAARDTRGFVRDSIVISLFKRARQGSHARTGDGGGTGMEEARGWRHGDGGGTGMEEAR